LLKSLQGVALQAFLIRADRRESARAELCWIMTGLAAINISLTLLHRKFESN